MAKSKTPEDPTTGQPPDPSAALMALNPMALEAWQDVMTECNRFFMDRLQQDLDTQKAMLNCKSPTELLQVQTEFYQTAVAQYSEESMRLFKLMAEATQKTVETAVPGHKRKYDDVPL